MRVARKGLVALAGAMALGLAGAGALADMMPERPFPAPPPIRKLTAPVEAPVVPGAVLACAEPIVRRRTEELFRVPIGAAPTLGPKTAPVTIVEFADYQCPFCKRAQETLAKVREHYGDDVRIVFKHNPLPFHKDARAAALVAVAAHEHKKFWQIHERFYADPSHLLPADLAAHWKALALPGALEPKLAKSVELGLDAAVDEDMALAKSLGATGTPTFFINGRKLTGAQPFEKFAAVIDAALVEAHAVTSSCGVKAGPPLYAAIVGRGRSDPEPMPAKPSILGPSAGPSGRFLHDVPIGGAPVRGPGDALVTIVMFTDFQCPFCARVIPTIKTLLERHADVRLAFKHFPLDMHPDARSASMAAVAAHAQGRFWPYHDFLWSVAGKALKRDDLNRYAAMLAIDLKRFARDIDSPGSRAVVDEDVALGKRLGVSGTPCFFVNGKKISGAMPLETFETEVTAARAVAKELIATGVPRKSVYEAIRKTATVR